ncbi:CvpA family protein [Halotalea alkalilenta]|uniref:CvpA family protein n=1 Tax=Halotalea alkalilenta TaxID=376489 RepID=UPI0004885C15|nr:CvpA family protein [Halotalea alkalilenta]
MSLTWLDWVFIAILALCVLLGAMRGLIREGLGLVVWVVALLTARAFCIQVGELFVDYIDNPSVRVVVGFVLVTFVVVILGGLCIRLLNAMVEWVGMGSFNRLLGALFGAAKGSAVLALIGVVIPLTPFAQMEAWQGSQLRPMVASLQQVIVDQYQRLQERQSPLEEPRQDRSVPVT